MAEFHQTDDGLFHLGGLTRPEAQGITNAIANFIGDPHAPVRQLLGVIYVGLEG